MPTRLIRIALALGILMPACTGSPLALPGIGGADLGGSPAPAPPPAQHEPACDPRPVRLTYEFADGTTESDRALMRRAMELVRPYFPLHYPRYARYSYEQERYVCYPGRYTEPVRTTFEAPPDDRVGQYSPGRGITIFVGTDGWQRAPASARSTIMFHEAHHWYQELAPKNEIQVNGFRRDHPNWLIEGTAQWFAYEAAVRFGLYPSMDAARGIESGRIVHPRSDLPGFESRYRVEFTAYPLYFAAVDRLIADHGGTRALRRYWDFEDDDVHWREVFQDAFGVSVRKFYKEFAAT